MRNEISDAISEKVFKILAKIHLMRAEYDGWTPLFPASLWFDLIEKLYTNRG